jgi:tRNA threonylcarbamoyl adenosine modification protein YeaZ
MNGATAGPPGRPLLVVDTATTVAVIALGTADGTLVAARSWMAGYRHGEELLAQIETLLRDSGLAREGIGGLVVGTGPGAFTGLRVGLATVKGLAYALHLPVVGVPTSAALLRAGATAAGGPALVLVQPAGPSDRVLSRPGEPSRILPGGADPELRPGERLVAVDLDGREAPDAAALGSAARDGLAQALLAAGARRLASGDPDDLARLVPEYVTLPRGVLSAPPDDGGVEITGGEAS